MFRTIEQTSFWNALRLSVPEVFKLPIVSRTRDRPFRRIAMTQPASGRYNNRMSKIRSWGARKALSRTLRDLSPHMATFCEVQTSTRMREDRRSMFPDRRSALCY
jgi:hypothetical protein